MEFSSQHLERAVDAFSRLPGIGRKSALRLALYLVEQDQHISEQLGQAVLELRRSICSCTVCNNLSDQPICHICSDPKRLASTICVVETVRDVIAVESTGQYHGLYHVLGGVISPVEGIGPENLNIPGLLERAHQSETKEVIMAISPTIEGETTIYYLSKQMADIPVTISTIARGVAFGGALEYADELTLGRSIASRLPYQARPQGQ